MGLSDEHMELYALDLGAAAGELLLQPLETAVEMIDAVDGGFALGRESADHERHGSAQIGRHDRGTLEPLHAHHGRDIAVERDLRAEPRQFLHVHEAVLEDRFADMRDALGARHQRHELRLQVGREARERFGRNIDRLNTRAVARDPQSFVGDGDFGPGFPQDLEGCGKQFLAGTREHHVAAGHGDGHRIGAGLDTVRQHGVTRALELVAALNADRGCACTFDLRAHRGDTVGDVLHLRLAGGVLDHGLALREGRGEQRGVGRADRNLGEGNLRTAQAAFGLRDHVTFLDLDIGTERAQRIEMEIDRPGSDRAAAGQRDLRLAHAGQERPDHPEARPHLGNEMIGRGGIDDVFRGKLEGLAGVLVVAGALAGNHDVHAVIAKDVLQEADVREARHVVEDQLLLAKQARDHERQGGILRPRNGDRAVQGAAAVDPDAVQLFLLRQRRFLLIL